MTSTFPFLLLLLLALPFLHPTHAVIPPSLPPFRARFNCPDFPPPHWIPQTHYPRLYPFCIAFACDCHPDERDPRGIIHRPVCDLLDLEPVVPSNLEHLSAALRVCQNTCGCYSGPASNWGKWPGGPLAVGPLVSAPAEGSGGVADGSVGGGGRGGLFCRSSE